MGLITKTIDKPFRIKAVSVERALDNLISRERKKADDKISYLEISLSELMLSLQEQPEKNEEPSFTLLTNDDSIKNRVQLSFRKVRKEVNLVTI
jgi:sugar-specific transcriptional regulator TrmB